MSVCCTDLLGRRFLEYTKWFPVLGACGRLSFIKYCFIHGDRSCVLISLILSRDYMGETHCTSGLPSVAPVSKYPKPASASAAGSQCVRSHSFNSPVRNDY
jgi:hypothetical protein